MFVARTGSTPVCGDMEWVEAGGVGHDNGDR